MKKISFKKIIWILGIFVLLIIIFYLVVEYKVKYQNRKIINYLYFYNCGTSEEEMCVSNKKTEISEDTLLYSIYTCGEEVACPTISKTIYNSNGIIVLKDNNTQNKKLYNYKKNKVLSKEYIDYYPLYKNDIIEGYIVVNGDNKYGIIDKDINVLVETSYEQIGTINDNFEVESYNYDRNYIMIKQNGKWGLMSLIDFTVKVECIYDDYQLLLDQIK